MGTLEKHVVDHYQRTTLDQAKLEYLLKETHRINRQRWLPKAAVAVMFLVVVTSALYFVSDLMPGQNQLILQEASINHRSKLQLEFDSGEMSALTTAMHKLDFPLRLPENLAQSVNVVGARYCTLNGNLAAHVKLKNTAESADISLFMTRSNPEFTKFGSHAKSIDGVDVSSWSADGVFYVLASSH